MTLKMLIVMRLLLGVGVVHRALVVAKRQLSAHLDEPVGVKVALLLLAAAMVVPFNHAVQA